MAYISKELTNKLKLTASRRTKILEIRSTAKQHKLITAVYCDGARYIDRVQFNIPLDTLQVILEMIFPTNHLAGTSKPNQIMTQIT